MPISKTFCSGAGQEKAGRQKWVNKPGNALGWWTRYWFREVCAWSPNTRPRVASMQIRLDAYCD